MTISYSLVGFFYDAKIYSKLLQGFLNFFFHFRLTFVSTGGSRSAKKDDETETKKNCSIFDFDAGLIIIISFT